MHLLLLLLEKIYHLVSLLQRDRAEGGGADEWRPSLIQTGSTDELPETRGSRRISGHARLYSAYMKEKHCSCCSSSPESSERMKGGAAETRRAEKGITSSVGQIRVRRETVSLRGDAVIGVK